MGFGATLASGDQNEFLPGSLLDCVTEVRIEQYLDRPTAFAIRFQEDVANGEPRIMSAAELQPERMFAVAVPAKRGLRCLVRGPLTDTACSVQLGGPGSWYEIRGYDRRIEMDRQCIRYPWEGRASEAAQSILSDYDFEPDVQQTTRVYSERDGTLNQRDTDLAFLEQIIGRNNLCLWLEYECERDGLDPTGGRLRVTEKANLKSSPPRPADSPGPPPSPADIQLAPTTELRLRVNVDPGQCQNVTAFRMDTDVERPNRFSGVALNHRDVQEQPTDAEDRQPPVRRAGRGLRELATHERQICVTSPGDQEELQPRAESALTEAGWFLNATASTTAHMLGGVLAPHDVIEVEGLGRRHSGAYQIKAVTHVINAADHHMDLQLRRNSLGRD